MKIQNKKKSFRKQLIFASSIFVILPLIIFIILFQGVKEIIVGQYSDAAKQSVKATAGNVDYYLGDIDKLTNLILTNHVLVNSLKNGDSNEFIKNLNSYIISNANIEGIYTTTSSGYLYVGADIKNDIQGLHRSQVRGILGQVMKISTKVQVLSGTLDKNYFLVSSKIVDLNSLKELGYVSIAIDESVIQEAYSTLEEDGSEVYILDNLGNIVSTTQKEGHGLFGTKKEYINTILQDHKTGYTEFKEEGVDYVAIYSSCNNDKWKIVKILPKSLLYKEINSVQRYLIISAGLFMVIMFIVSGFYSKTITEPITNMIKQMKKVEEGNLDIKLEINMDNEFDDLAENFNHMLGQIKFLMEKVVTSERNKNELELEVLHAQINPHFIYNTLNTIRWMAKIKNENSISDAIVALVKLLRVSISLDKNMITLKEEIDYIENYLLIQRLRFNHVFEIDYCIDDKYNGIMIPKLILQPIVENAIIYGVFETDNENEEDFKIWVYTQENDQDIDIVVEDNGPGIEEEILGNIFRDDRDINKFSKVGLNNVNQRLKMYFGEEYGLKITTEVGVGTKLTIKVPNRIEEI